jgi:hypothetical protein
MVDAVTAPVLLVVPVAWTHLPTARSLAAAVSVWVYVVDDVSVTVDVVVALVRGLVPCTVTVSPDTAVTFPNAAEKLPANPRARAAPDAPLGRLGNSPLAGALPAPAGGVAPPAGGVPLPPPNPPPKPRSHVPDVGVVMVTDVAVTGPVVVDLDDDPDLFCPMAVMHDPTVTLAAVPETD